jgi:hypothetical protein
VGETSEAIELPQSEAMSRDTILDLPPLRTAPGSTNRGCKTEQPLNLLQHLGREASGKFKELAGFDFRGRASHDMTFP